MNQTQINAIPGKLYKINSRSIYARWNIFDKIYNTIEDRNNAKSIGCLSANQTFIILENPKTVLEIESNENIFYFQTIKILFQDKIGWIFLSVKDYKKITPVTKS